MPQQCRVTLAEYDRVHQLSEKLSDAVNLCYLKQHDHPVAFLADHFARVGRSDAVERILCREVLDARGVPAVEATVMANGRALGTATVGGPLLLPRDVPGREHARGAACTVSKRDGCPETEEAARKERHAGKGVQKVAASCAAAATRCLGGTVCSAQRMADSALLAEDGTEQFSALGANAVAPVSLAMAAAGAECKAVPLWQHIAQLRWAETALPGRFYLPVPIMWLLAPPPGGKLMMQGVGLIPHSAPGTPFAQLQDACAEVYHCLGRKLQGARPDAAGIGHGGAYTYAWETLEVALDALKDAVAMAAADGKLNGIEMRLALQCGGSGRSAPSTPAGSYQPEEGVVKTWAELSSHYVTLADKEREAGKMPLMYIEDTHGYDDGGALEAEEWAQGLRLLGAELHARGHSVVISGCELYGSDPQRLRRGRKRRATSAAVVALDEAATVTQLCGAAAAWAAEPLQDGEDPMFQPAPAVPCGPTATHPVVVGMRPNDTACPHLADIAVGLQAHFVSLGGMASAESLAKWDRLQAIEDELSAGGLLRPGPQLSRPDPPDFPPGSKEVMEPVARRASKAPKKK
eukprot:TRINITY_DN19527_c0_g1_i1.p2 TRINITY_DN19527_c0_g1~~TRINITY_DN19527_c0_g1_i1.p2  ORF type:complete len:578 (+),score=113.86 TRINITY_DN19527_c0_g1_i1:76-1809(+)